MQVGTGRDVLAQFHLRGLNCALLLLQSVRNLRRRRCRNGRRARKQRHELLQFSFRLLFLPCERFQLRVSSLKRDAVLLNRGALGLQSLQT